MSEHENDADYLRGIANYCLSRRMVDYAHRLNKIADRIGPDAIVEPPVPTPGHKRSTPIDAANGQDSGVTVTAELAAAKAEIERLKRKYEPDLSDAGVRDDWDRSYP